MEATSGPFRLDHPRVVFTTEFGCAPFDITAESTTPGPSARGRPARA
jgi:hypothetical protein